MIVVFDMDECIASLSEPCIEYHTYVEKGVDIPKRFEHRFQNDLQHKYLRPGIDEILKVLYDCKRETRKRKKGVLFPIKYIVLMTNASNKYAWVNFVISQIEYLLGAQDDIFDILLPRDSHLRKQVPYDEFHKYGGMQPKFMDDVVRSLRIKKNYPIIMYDDCNHHLVPAKDRLNYFTKVPAYYAKDHAKHDRARTFATFLPPLFMAFHNLRS